VPLFVFSSLQVSLLPGLAGAVAEGDEGRFRQLMGRGFVIVTLLGTGAGIPAVIAGPWLIRLLFGAHPVLGRADFALLVGGTLCYMLAMVFGQGAMAAARHRDQLLAWLAGAVALAAVTLGPGQIRLRVEAGYALGSLTVAGLLALVLWRRGLIRSSRYAVARPAGYRPPRAAPPPPVRPSP
jgi:O-antigen/teichoic acid export membrane protein